MVVNEREMNFSRLVVHNDREKMQDEFSKLKK